MGLLDPLCTYHSMICEQSMPQVQVQCFILRHPLFGLGSMQLHAFLSTSMMSCINNSW